MAPIRNYKPLNLNVNPFAIATDMAKPIDFTNTLREIQGWENLANNEAISEQNQIKAEELARQQEFSQAKQEEAIRAYEAGEDPLLAIQEAEKKIGDVLALERRRIEDREFDRKNEIDTLSEFQKINAIAQNNPVLAQALANERGLASYVAPQQKTGGEGGKRSKPQLVFDGSGYRVIGLEPGQPIPASLMKEAMSLGEDPEMLFGGGAKKQALPQENPGPGFFESIGRFLADKSGAVAPAAVPTPTPRPGFKLQRNKVTGEIREVPL
jgi:hypothetical protein